MEKVKQIIEISSKIETIQQFCDFIGDVYKITNCKKSDCPIATYWSDLKKVVFIECFFIKFSMESPEIFSAIFGLQNKGKENVKKLLDSFEAPATEEQDKKNNKEYLLQDLRDKNKKLRGKSNF